MEWIDQLVGAIVIVIVGGVAWKLRRK